MPSRVYVDACVLIAAARGADDEISRLAIAELDQDAEFLYSSIVELETIPQPTIHGYRAQLQFFQDFFALAERIECTDQVQQSALAEACRGVGLHAADALHVACAIAGRATELLTSEKPTETLPQAQGISVRTLRLA